MAHEVCGRFNATDMALNARIKVYDEGITTMIRQHIEKVRALETDVTNLQRQLRDLEDDYKGPVDTRQASKAELETAGK